MAAVVAVVLRCGHVFSGGATARVVDDVGGDVTGRRGPSVAARVMIARARTPDRLGVVGPCCQWWTVSPAVMRTTRAVLGARLPQSYKSRERGEKSLTSSLSIRRPLLLASAPWLRTPLFSPPAHFAFARRRLPHFSTHLQWPRLS
jgi:hypothetical protein